MSERRPNILLVMADQHRADVLGAAGDPVVHTPTLDRLAADGVRFTEAYCQGPLCMPSRVSLLTERHVRHHGVSENRWNAPDEMPTIVQAVAEAGYHTACIGKMHLWVHGARAGRDTRDQVEQMHGYGFAEPLETAGKLASAGLRSEYTDYLSARGCYDAYREWMAARRYGGRQSGRRMDRVPIWNTDPNPVPAEDYIDAWHGRRVAQWIDNYDRAEPFLLWVGFPGPHDPWDAPAEYVDRYRDTVMPMPRSSRPPTALPSATAQALYDYVAAVHSDSSHLTDEVIADVRRSYYANVTLIDDAVAGILAALQRCGMLDHTWVIYTSDHGEMLGEHRLLTKIVFYDQAIKVPLIIQPPGGGSGRTVPGLVEHLDLGATIRAIAGAPAKPGFAGNSLLPLMAGDLAKPSREAIISENFGLCAIRTTRHKLVVDGPMAKPVQFFNLKADPYEDNNLLDQDAAPPGLDEILELHARPFLATEQVQLGPGILDLLSSTQR